ncbi:hypothetical protein [Acuticoccus sp. I52.16.1]|uniref:hypothetical protein n=1 Tax=Acuticoccus sp. I52.16.1 TaxID=2928472 RepID=UPI001FD07CA4|nr:hypothetical protein [Acuticoccus sp. I52.16.1]UOM35080.1 hypothetical protein MRB58_02385 [Acuticoccus sp. I52.16.1]
MADQDPDPGARRLREALFAYFAGSSRAAAIGLECPALREHYGADENWERFEAADVAPCAFRYRLHCEASGPFGAAQLLIGLPAGAEAAQDAALDAVRRSVWSWASAAPYGATGLGVALPVPLMTVLGGFDAHAAELALRWFRMLADWWDRDGRALIPDATVPARGETRI